MAPQCKNPIKVVSKMQRPSAKSIIDRSLASSAKKVPSKNVVDKTPFKVNSMTMKTRQRTSSVPRVETPKPKVNESNTVPKTPKSVSKSSWKRRPLPAHSGVPVPEKMKKMMLKMSQNLVTIEVKDMST